MAETASKMLPLGTTAPDFALLDTISEKIFKLKDMQPANATVIMFICNHCPYVKFIQTKLVDVANHYSKKGVQFIAINSNDISSHPTDAPEYMKQEAMQHHYPFPYLFDETQDVAKAYQAACTPDFYIFDKNLHCVYRGRFDDATPRSGKTVTGKDLSLALDNLLSDKPIDENQIASLGCNIKWK